MTSILLHADGHYRCPEVLDWCRANDIDFIFGVAPTATLRAHIKALETGTKARFDAVPSGNKPRRYKEFHDLTASWSRVERIIARVEARPECTDSRFVVTNLEGRSARRCQL